MQREQLPKRLRDNQIPGGEWCNRLLDSIKSIWPIETPTARPITTQDGTGYQVKRTSKGGTSDGSSIYALVKWNSGSSKYDWQEAVLTSGVWTAKTGGLSTADYVSPDTGTADQPLALHESGLTDLPDGIAVKMSFVVDSTNAVQPVFEVPLQMDSSFAHRTAITGSPTAGNRADYTLTENELETQANTVGMYDTWNAGTGKGILESQTSTIGWVRTELFRPWYYLESDSNDAGGGGAAGDQNIYCYVIDVEYDVLGRIVSYSDAFRYTMHVPGPCDTT